MTADDVDAIASYLAGPADEEHRPDLDRIKRLLADEATWHQPRPELAESIIERITMPSAALPAKARRRWARPVAGATVAGAAAAALAVGLLVMDEPRATDDESTNQLALSGTELAPTASATADVVDTPIGVAINLRIDGLAPAPDGFYYQAWVKGPAGLVAVGTFHLRSPGNEPIELWSGVDLAEYPALTVTLEPEDGDPASSGQRVLTSP